MSGGRTTRLLKMIIMGAPGSGKGTISKRIVSDLHLHFLSSGDALRNEIESKNDVGRLCEKYMKKGLLVPDEILDRIIFDKLKSFKDAGWLLDGFPRTLTQAIALYREELVPDLVIDLQVPFEVIIDRLKDRWVHPGSGRIYNLQYNKPKIPGLDDLTGEPLIQRHDDQPDTVLARLEHYKELTIPVSEFFRDRHKLVSFTGSESDVIWPEIRKYLHDYLDRRQAEDESQIYL
ncbi:hypothetical protein HELRODRAFT_114439 [Helobdella robusta]|uniref:GTP:AMP phosphotransferase, mitochondrial n=1 Tax=Helobdella robusta TaxID=6412 RepID=T1EG17_HELRO|nr:hypothetical protein HELRODRAFT_114439 [Helobdella robusta]ESN96886.1 hypothetical protein HELRODRAFT_114439 [Helobdella robusta]